MRPSHRDFKNGLYEQFARVGKTLGNPHRLELLELLAPGERTVESLATETRLSVELEGTASWASTCWLFSRDNPECMRV